eukprot:COSAG03_NODE_1348_length_4281_cov_116.671927_5_plen_75_part_00
MNDCMNEWRPVVTAVGQWEELRWELGGSRVSRVRKVFNDRVSCVASDGPAAMALLETALLGHGHSAAVRRTPSR